MYKIIVYFLFVLVFVISRLSGYSYADEDIPLENFKGEQVISGKVIYEAHCAGCHGFAGDGNGPAAGNMNPKPTNFTDPQIMSQLTYVDMERTVIQGKPNTEMNGFSNLFNNDEVRKVINYLKSFSTISP